MKVYYPKLNLEIPLQENMVTDLIIENPSIMSDFIGDLWRQMSGQPGEIALLDGITEFSVSKRSILISNPFEVNCNEKRIVTALYKELKTNADEVYQNRLETINSEIVNVLDDLFNTVPYNLTSADDLDVSALLKLYDVKIESTDCTMEEMLTDYIRVVHDICNIDIVFFLNLKQYMTQEILQEFYKFCNYKKMCVVNIEGQATYVQLEGEHRIVIDNDLCIIYS